MGKRIISQRRGKGSSTYRIPQYDIPRIQYRDKPGRIADIIRTPLGSAPLARVLYDDKSEGFIIAQEGMRVGDAMHAIVRTLESVDEGAQIFAIETYPNSGPKLCRSGGSFATLVSKSEKECIIQLPSKKTKQLNPRCRVTLGIPAGEGRREKPWVKAGKKWIAMHSRGKLYPRTSAVAMNAVDHPFGSGYSGLGKPKSVSRHAPPGRKVGAIAPRRMGRRKVK